MAEKFESHDQPTGEVQAARRSLVAEIGDPEEYQYVTPEETSAMLGEFGYGDGWKWIQAAYHHPATEDRPAMTVGVMHITENIGRDHFGIVPGVLITEAVNQTALAHGRLTGQITGDMRPLLKRNVSDYKRPTVSEQPIDLNILVQQIPNTEGFQLHGEVVAGKRVITQVEVEGAIGTAEFIEGMKGLQAKAQAKITPLFPLK